MISIAISHSIRLIFQLYGISSMMSNLATIIKGVLTLGESSKYKDPIYQPMKDNLGEGLGDHPISQGGLTHTSPRLE